MTYLRYGCPPGEAKYWDVMTDDGQPFAVISGNWRIGYLVLYGEGLDTERLFETLPAAKRFALALPVPPPAPRP